MPEIADRLLRVQIENRPANDVLRLYDSADTLFYCDPPYIHETRGDSKAYGYEMTDQQHRELAKVLNTVKGMVAISNYRCSLMDELYPAPRWRKIVGPARTNHATKGTRVEVLWVNLPETQKQAVLQIGISPRNISAPSRLIAPNWSGYKHKEYTARAAQTRPRPQPPRP